MSAISAATDRAGVHVTDRSGVEYSCCSTGTPTRYRAWCRSTSATHRLRIVASSPSDVADERNQYAAVVQELNLTLGALLPERADAAHLSRDTDRSRTLQMARADLQARRRLAGVRPRSI